MNAERIGLAVLGLACVGLLGWNLSLSTQLATLESQAAVAAQAEAPAAVVAGDPAARPDRMKARKSGGGGWNHGGDRPMRGGAPMAEDNDAEADRGERRERRQRDWGAMRADMETKTIDTVEAYGIQNNWEPQTTEDILSILLDTSDAIAEVWTQASDGDLTHYQARKEMMGLRQSSADDIIAMIGEPAYEGLDEHLWEARHEVWRSGHDRASSDDKAE